MIADIERAGIGTPLHKGQSRVESGHQTGNAAVHGKQRESALSIRSDQRLAVGKTPLLLQIPSGVIGRGVPPFTSCIYVRLGWPASAPVNQIRFPSGKKPSRTPTRRSIPGMGTEVGSPAAVGKIVIFGGGPARKESAPIAVGEAAAVTSA